MNRRIIPTGFWTKSFFLSFIFLPQSRSHPFIEICFFLLSLRVIIRTSYKYRYIHVLTFVHISLKLTDIRFLVYMACTIPYLVLALFVAVIIYSYWLAATHTYELYIFDLQYVLFYCRSFRPRGDTLLKEMMTAMSRKARSPVIHRQLNINIMYVDKRTHDVLIDILWWLN